MSHMLSRNEVTEVTLSDLYWKAKDAYDDLWTMANERDRHVKLYLHWTAGRYHQFWDDYHVQIDNDGKIYMPDGTSLSDILSGTWRRNTAAISISILGCFDATTGNGQFQCRKRQCYTRDSVSRSPRIYWAQTEIFTTFPFSHRKEAIFRGHRVFKISENIMSALDFQWLIVSTIFCCNLPRFSGQKRKNYF